MVKNVSEAIKNNVLELLTDANLRFFQTSDNLNSEAVASLILESRRVSSMPVERAIVLHRAVLIKELYYGNSQASIVKILNVFKDVKNQKVFRDYLLTIPEEAVEYYKKASTLSFFISKDIVNEWQNNITATIEKFLKQ